MRDYALDSRHSAAICAMVMQQIQGQKIINHGSVMMKAARQIIHDIKNNTINIVTAISKITQTINIIGSTTNNINNNNSVYIIKSIKSANSIFAFSFIVYSVRSTPLSIFVKVYLVIGNKYLMFMME